MISSIYRLIMSLAHKNILQYKRKNMRRNWARNLMLTCLDVYTYLSHFLLSFYYYYYCRVQFEAQTQNVWILGPMSPIQ